MIRFIDLGRQVAGDDEDGPKSFAFFDTVIDQFLAFDGDQVFETREEFDDACAESLTSKDYDDRCRRLIPEDWP